MSVPQEVFHHFYPDQSKSGTLYFYARLRQDITSGKMILNLGAGPGDIQGSEVFAIRDLRMPDCRVLGCDPDPTVLKNVQLDDARVMESDGRIPHKDGIFDMVYCDYVLEHVESPEQFIAEVYRVLKPGGSFFFRTPSAWHYVSIAARLLPHWVHERVANKARGLSADAHEPYPTYHRMNTRRVLRRLAKRAGFCEVELVMFEGEPSYLMFNSLAFLMGVAYERAVNATPLLSGLRANIMGKVVK